MSREIKFRVWSGDQMVSPDYITRDGIGYWKEDSIPSYSTELMQFTGLKDRNGIDIYEGDIVKRIETENIREYCSVVRYEEREFTTMDWDLLPEHDCVLDYIPEVIEVVGNIYEN
jgi:hypothetical protein